MQVAQEQAPPQSASMPATIAFTAPSMTDWPPAMSTVCSLPSGSSNVIFAIPVPLAFQFLHCHALVAKSRRIEPGSVSNELLGHHEFRRPVHGVNCKQRALPEIEHGERPAFVGIATHDGLVVASGEPNHLQLHVVLVR